MGYKLVTWWFPGRNVHTLVDEDTGMPVNGGSFEIKLPTTSAIPETKAIESLRRLKAQLEAEHDIKTDNTK